MHWTRKSQTLSKSIFSLFILLFNFTDITGSQRYRDAFQQSHEQRQSQKPKPKITILNQSWQILFKVAASRNRRTKRCGYAFEARKMDGMLLFRGGASSGRQTQLLAVQEVLMEALIKVNRIGMLQSCHCEC